MEAGGERSGRAGRRRGEHTGDTGTNGERLTPMRRQYLAIKRQHPDAILFFRLGDFYETFDADAELVARVLRITLTSREVGKGQRVPLAGVPYHSAESYIARLVAAGHRVAICEQMEATPRVGSASRFARGGPNNKDMLTREVVRVVTAGTVVEPRMLEARRNNYLCALVAAYGPTGAPHYGLAHADVTTGEFAVTELSGDEAAGELARELDRLQPAECIIPGATRLTSPARNGALPGLQEPEAAEPPSLEAQAAHDRHERTLEAWRFERGTAHEALCRLFGVSSLEGFGCAHLPLAVRAAGGLVAYVEQTNRPLLALLEGIRTYEPGAFMRLDGFTRRNLELLEGASVRRGEPAGPARPTLLTVLDETETPMGGRLLRQWLGQPLMDLDQLHARHDVVEALVDNGVLRGRVRATLQRVADVERLTNRARQGAAFPRELLALRQSLVAAEELRTLGEGTDRSGQASPPPAEEVSGVGSSLAHLLTSIDPCPDVTGLIERAVYEPTEAESRGAALGTWEEARLIKPGYSQALDDLIRSSADARSWIAGLESAERERTGIKSLKVGFNKVFGYYLHISHAYKGDVPAHYIRRQTLTDGERYITPELKEYESLVLHAQERIADLERELYAGVQQEVAARAGALLATAGALARLDTLASFAEVAVRRGFVRPALDDGTALEIVQGRHPVVEAALDAATALVGQPASFVPNDCALAADGEQVVILTGPNMAGKSTYLRSVALIALLAQAGSFVPAQRARVGLVDRIFTRVGAQDDLAAGQSTFMVEMLETASILRHATRRSLVILDEIGRGTSTYDGVAIAQSVVEYLHGELTGAGDGPRTLFATHFHELAELEQRLPRVRNYRMDVVEDGEQVVFLHRVVPGNADRSYGIHVARLAGVPRAVTQRAAEVLADLEARRQAAPAPGWTDPVRTDPVFAEPASSDAPGGPAPSGWPEPDTDPGDGERAPLVPVARAGSENGSGNGHAIVPIRAEPLNGHGHGVSRAMQLALFVPSHPLLEELKRLDVMNMTPLQAMNALADLATRAKDA